MNPAVATIIVAAVGVVGAVLGAAVSAWMRRDVDEADVAEKISKAYDPTMARLGTEIERLSTKCDKCETRLDLVRRDFGAFADVVETLIPLLPDGEPQRKARVALTAARLSSLSHNG